ncbi:threonine synthase [Herbidospora daliensis]|uniref:threonine synthase n=1 Tax=Herbidospora daliensis TaxID=295585 RepID=UPI000A00FE1B|nr:pyridoxal-phosphate dependent enzyme [Herbidospora daliensis]
MYVDAMDLRCSSCDVAADPLAWACPSCGGPLDVPSIPLAGSPAGEGVWRYRDWLPAVDGVSLGEPTTPLVRMPWDGLDLTLKLEGALPTGSFKDRGTAVLVSWLAAHGASSVVIDSSGNAGAALAAYSARAGLTCHVYAPASASPGKLRQIAAYGAELHAVPGTRQAVADAAVEHARATGDVYASHAWHAMFIAGTRTFAFEAWEQMGVPDAVVLPVGAGTLMLGLAHGFADLRAAGLTDRVPEIYAIQSTACAPLVTDGPEPVEVVVGDTAAEGVKIAHPPRGRAIIAHATDVLAVDDAALWTAHERFRRAGVYTEPTSALAPAGLTRLTGRLTGKAVLMPITATGLKSPA